MKHGFGKIKLTFLFLGSFFVVALAEIKYVPRFTDSVVSCKNFDNKAFDCDGLVLGHSQGDDGDDAACLGGEMKALEELGDTVSIEMEIWKVTDNGEEMMFSTASNFCACLKDDDTPWWPIVEKLDLKCPIPKKTFAIDKMEISLDSVKDYLSHDFCGEYRIEISFVDKAEKLSCHVFEIAIDEVNDDE